MKECATCKFWEEAIVQQGDCSLGSSDEGGHLTEATAWAWAGDDSIVGSAWLVTKSSHLCSQWESRGGRKSKE